MNGRKFIVVGAVALAVAWASSCKKSTSRGPAPIVPIPAQKAASFSSVSSKQVIKEARQYPKQKAAPVQELPMSLTTSDGTGLQLVSLSGKAVVQGPLAFTELHLTFHNPENRVREGRFTITLPPGAAISRFAMKIQGGWQEAEVVELQRARQIYEDFLHRRQDPALLEKKAGNQFRARIFPIPAGADKEIKISYSQELASAKDPYRLVLKGLPKMKALKINAFVGQQVVGKGASSLGGVTVNNKVIRVDRSDHAPDRDFEVKTQSSIAGLRHENLVLARVAPRISAAKVAIQSMLLLVDTSASRAAGFNRQVEQVGALVHHLKTLHGGDLRLQVACFDQGVGSVFDGPVRKFSSAHLDEILARRPLGASDLHRALKTAAAASGFQRVLLVTDGIPTAGATKGKALRAAVVALKGKVERLDVMLVGGIRDEEGMRKLITGALDRDGLVLDGTKGAAELAQSLSRKTVSKIKVTVPGAKWVWPSTLDGVQPGDHVLVFADLPPGALAEGKPATVELSGPISQKESITLARVKRPLLERAWVKARMARLNQQRAAAGVSPDLAAAVRKQIIALSTKYRVLSDFTALLVLETEADYRRYNIERTALANILVVGAAGLEVAQRAAPIVRQRPAPARTTTQEESKQKTDGKPDSPKMTAATTRAPPPPRPSPVMRDEAAASAMPRKRMISPGARRMKVLGGKGTTSGNVQGLGGRVGGPGQIGASRALRETAPKARVTVTAFVVTGADEAIKKVARRVVRRGQRALQSCYQRALRRKPTLAGTLVLRLEVATTGRVVQAAIESDSIGDPMIAGCTRQLARRWRFPPPKATMTIKITLAFASGGAPRRAPAPGHREHAAGDEPSGPPALSGKLALVMAQLKMGAVEKATVGSLRWRAEQPGNVLALLALGESLHRGGNTVLAARAYGSIVDLFPSRADMRRFAAGRLETLGDKGLALAADSYEKAVEQRPDHGSGHRMLAHTLVRMGRHEQAMAALEKALTRRHSISRSGVERILREDLALVAAAFAAKSPDRKPQIRARLEKLKIAPADKPSLRFVLSWETDANDVDFHIRDGQGGHASYRNKHLPSGGDLYADVTNGYGPECFTIDGALKAFPYRLQIHYYSRGPMGYGMGMIQMIQHDGKGGLKYGERPFVVMNDSAYVNLGVVKEPL